MRASISPQKRATNRSETYTLMLDSIGNIQIRIFIFCAMFASSPK